MTSYISNHIPSKHFQATYLKPSKNLPKKKTDSTSSWTVTNASGTMRRNEINFFGVPANPAPVAGPYFQRCTEGLHRVWGRLSRWNGLVGGWVGGCNDRGVSATNGWWFRGRLNTAYNIPRRPYLRCSCPLKCRKSTAFDIGIFWIEGFKIGHVCVEALKCWEFSIWLYSGLVGDMFLFGLIECDDLEKKSVYPFIRKVC